MNVFNSFSPFIMHVPLCLCGGQLSFRYHRSFDVNRWEQNSSLLRLIAFTY